MLLLLVAVSSNARVFWRWGAAAESDLTVESAGGKIAYAADVTLNGGRGRLAVFAFDRPIGDVVGALRASFNTGDIALAEGGTMSTGVVRADGRVLHFVIVDPRSTGETIVFKLDQSEAAARQSANPPRNPIAAVPSYPDAETQFYVRDDRARTDFAVSLSNAHPADVAAFYADRLRADGWRCPLPPASAGTTRPSMQVFENPDALCCVYVAPADDGRRTQIALLHKETGGDITPSR